MDAASPLTKEETALLRAYVAGNQPGRWRRWKDCALFAFISLGCFAAGQWMLRWLPGRLEGRGLALCQSHQTLHKGTVWWPSPEMDLFALLKGPAGGLMICAYFLGMMGLIILVEQAKARRMAMLLARLHPELSTTA